MRQTKSLPIITANRSSKINKGNQFAPAVSHVSPVKRRTNNASAVKINKGGQSPMPSSSRGKRHGDVPSSSKMKNGNQSPSTLRRVNTEVDLKMKKGNLSPYVMSPLNKWSSSEIRGRSSPLSTNPSVPYARITSDHASDSEASFTFSPYANISSGHASD